MWNDWLEFQAEMKRSREEEKKQRVKAKLKRKKMLINGAIICGAIALALGAVVGFFVLLLKYS
jgi:hypothetical protein